jgi:hypothetical protein
LHDAGGDRSQTIAALPYPGILAARGDTVVPAGKLLGLNRDHTMPHLVEKADRLPTDRQCGLLVVVHWGEELLWAFMIVTSLLTLLRSIALAILSLSRKPMVSSADFAPSISVLIAAFNEEKVIAATLRSVLKTDYRGPIEVIVVDDGSADATAARAEAIRDPRIRVLRQSNRGKSAALTRGLESATNGIVIFLDADTQFLSYTLRPSCCRSPIRALSGIRTRASATFEPG